ncbi:MAG: anti-sigma F factor [Eubacteriales bacterium]|nr:anti-sigma F factor [Eubacteriales bacterium]
MKYDNKVSLIIDANSKNESFARVSVASFATQLDPTLEDINDIKMAVSEAVTNAIIHGYDGEEGEIYINLGIIDDTLHIEIEDKGKGIEDIEKAMEPLYTSKPHMERSGMGFTVMEAFMDEISVISNLGKGTKIYMNKQIKKN